MNQAVVNRRAFLQVAGKALSATAAAGAATAVASRSLLAQQPQSAASNVVMPESAYKPVSLPPKANAVVQMDQEAVNTFERDLACPCPCTQSVYSCRTTDFSCSISPAVHGDIEALVKGGYNATEIMAALTDTYGEFILMAPRKRGFSLLAWFTPFAALAVGVVVVGTLLRGWRKNGVDAANARLSQAGNSPQDGEEKREADFGATPDELARLEAAVRNDS